ncbi:MAG: phosphoribosylaminoimidazolesuccinocarboxamide synthase [Acidobacteria bacterium]|nr:MAG: phosphoribosylaminoimidazolesuccinocarboxamide synthase [Acidobacteriota bacterium]PIE89743.1 MAG: phosphoribosylaminoimidazolesuccinocarboxamide synthase [Acidobacteriota bacterium]
MTDNRAITKIEIKELKKIRSGKVREIYDLGNSYLFIATDRISAYDCILPTGIPGKGQVLTKLSHFWFELLDVPNHLIADDVNQIPDEYAEVLAPYRSALDGRFMIVKKLKMIPIECVVRGYLVGSGYKEYKASQSVCSIPLPSGLNLASKLPETLFTPAAKNDEGHDENISFEAMSDLIGEELSVKLRDLSIDIYHKAYRHAIERGVIIADTKFEFGLYDGEIVLADEVLTPDSSRYWPKDSYAEGANPPSYDKQFVRDYLQGLDWNKQPPAPELPEHIVTETVKKYRECLNILTR